MRPIITGVVFAAVIGMTWLTHRQLASQRDLRGKLIAQATAQGLTVDAGNSGTLSLPSKLPRVNRVAEAKQIASEFMAFGDDLKGLERDSDPDALDEATRQRITAQMDRLKALDGEQLKILIADIYAVSGGTYEYRDLICYALHRLVEDHPEDALKILMTTPGMLELVRHNGVRAPILISVSLSRLAARDPAAALKWFRENRERLSFDEREMAGDALLQEAAARDPSLVLGMIDEFGHDPNVLANILPRSTPQQRTASLVLLREWKAGKGSSRVLDEAFQTALKSLAFRSPNDPFEGRGSFKDSAAWIDQAQLSKEELAIVAGNLQNSIHSEDSAQWIGWLERNLPPEVAGDWTDSIFGQWVSNDPKAAEGWLESAPAGPARNSAVAAYVRTMARVNPEKAIQQALTLPEGWRRKDALREIHSNWPRKDTDEAAMAAAKTFAEKYGIKE